MKEMNAKYAGYCNRCYFSFYKNERILYRTKPYHVNCIIALRDKYPRRLEASKKRIYGDVNQQKIALLLEMEGYAPPAP